MRLLKSMLIVFTLFMIFSIGSASADMLRSGVNTNDVLAGQCYVIHIGGQLIEFCLPF